MLPFSQQNRASFGNAAVALAVVLTTVGCTSPSRPRPALQVDVAQYVARINQWAKAEREVSAAISEIFRSHFLDVDRVTSITDRMLPTIDEQVAAIGRYAPDTPEVTKIHARYAGAWQGLREGFDLIHRGMMTGDGIRLAKGRRHLELWSEDMVRVANELRKLGRAVGINKAKAGAAGMPFQQGKPIQPSAPGY